MNGTIDGGILRPYGHPCGAGTTPRFPNMSGTTLPPKEGHVNWILLIIAGLFEIGWVYALKQSDNFANLKFAFLAVFLLAISMACLSLSLRTIPVGTAYAVWTGIGAVGAATLGILAFGDPATAMRLVCIALIVIGVVGLKLASA